MQMAGEAGEKTCRFKPVSNRLNAVLTRCACPCSFQISSLENHLSDEFVMYNNRPCKAHMIGQVPYLSTRATVSDSQLVLPVNHAC